MDETVCIGCGAIFTHKKHGVGRKYCSRECSNKKKPWNTGIPRSKETIEKIKRTKSKNKNPITEAQRRGLKIGQGLAKGRILSEEAKRKIGEAARGRIPWNKKPDVKCKYCNKKLTRRNYKRCSDCYESIELPIKAKKRVGIPLSIEHRKKISENRKKSTKIPRGENHPSWKGGITPEHEKTRKSNSYKAWRLSVFKRDHFTCQDCGVKGGTLEAHHIKPFSEYPEDRLSLENGITYCKQCHIKNDLQRR